MRNESGILGFFLAAATLALTVAGCEAGTSTDQCQAGETCVCDGATACERSCDGPDCDFRCSGTGTCTLRCEAGGCSAVANGEGTAQLACPGGNCRLTCRGTGTCQISECRAGCEIECLGTGTCRCASGCTGEGEGEGEGEGSGEGEGEGDSDVVSNCAELCDLTEEATTQEGNCVGGYLQGKGYPIATTAQCYDLETVAECNACYAIVKPKDSDCVAAHQLCF